MFFFSFLQIKVLSLFSFLLYVVFDLFSSCLFESISSSFSLVLFSFHLQCPGLPWWSLCTPIVGAMGSILGWGSKIPHAAFSSVQSHSRVQLFVTSWTAARQASLSITNSRSFLKLKSIELVMPSSHLILCCPLLLPPSIFPSIRVFSNESILRIKWPRNWSFNISPSSEYSGLISFRIDWFDLLVVQETLKNLLQYHSSKASILRCSAFFIVQLSHPYMTIGKTIALTRRTFVGK